MARIPEYPPILNGSTELQIAQIREFLMRLVRDLADAGIYDESTGAAEIEAVDQKIDDLADSLADVATSGSYNDLTDRPVIPPSAGVDTAMSDTSENAVQNKVIKAYVDGSVPDVPTRLSQLTDDLGSSPVHTHSQYLTEHQSLAGYVQTTDARLSDARNPLPHNHDDRYYTEAEIDSKLADKVEEPDADGSAGQVLATDGDGGRYWKTVEGGGGGGTSDYTELENKPKINNVELVGNKTLAQIGAAAAGDIPDSLSELTDDLGSNPVHTHSQYLTEHQSLAAYRTSAAQDAIDATKQNTISDLASIRTGAALGATAVQPVSGKGLFSGNYNDLTNKPTIPPAITVDTVMSGTSTNPVQNKVVKEYVDNSRYKIIPMDITARTYTGYDFAYGYITPSLQGYNCIGCAGYEPPNSFLHNLGKSWNLYTSIISTRSDGTVENIRQWYLYADLSTVAGAQTDYTGRALFIYEKK